MANFFSQYFAACTEQSFFSLPTWYRYLQPVEEDGVCRVPFSIMENGIFNGDGMILVILGIIDILIRLAALVAVGFVIYGGFKYMTSQGSPEGTKNAQSTILNAVIGLAVAILASAIVFFVGSSLGGASGSSGGSSGGQTSCEGSGPC